MATQYPAWSWVDVTADQRDTNGRSFAYVYRCPGCGEDQRISSADVQARSEHTGGLCQKCHGHDVPADFWEVQEPIERFTVTQRDGASWVARLYRFAPGADTEYPDSKRELFRAVVTGNRDDVYTTTPNAEPYYALADALGYITRRALKVTKTDT